MGQTGYAVRASDLADLACGIKEIAYLFDHIASGIASYTNVPSYAWPDFGKDADRAYEDARKSMGEAVGDKSTTEGVGGIGHTIVERLIAVIGGYGEAEKASSVAAFDVAKALGAGKNPTPALSLINEIDHASPPPAHRPSFAGNAPAIGAGINTLKMYNSFKRAFLVPKGAPLQEVMWSLGRPIRSIRYDPLLQAVRNNRVILMRAGVAFGVDALISFIDQVYVAPNEVDPAPFVAEQDRWHKIAEATGHGGGIIDAVNESLARCTKHWVGDASDAVVKYVDSVFVPAIVQFSELARVVSVLCGDIARALHDFMTMQKDLQIGTAIALMLINPISLTAPFAGMAVAAAYGGIQFDKYGSMKDLFAKIADEVRQVTEGAKSLHDSCKDLISKRPTMFAQDAGSTAPSAGASS